MGLSLLETYSWLLANWINGGAYQNPGRLKATSIDPQYNFIFTKTGVKQIYRVQGIKPTNFDLDFVSFFRDKMFELHPDVELSITIDNHPVTVSVTNEKFSRAFSKVDEQYTTYKEAFDSQSGVARMMGKTYRLPGGGRLRLSRDKLDTLFQLRESYRTIFEHVSNGGTLTQTNIFFEITGRDVRSVRRAGNDLYGILSSLNIGCDVVKSANKAYLTEMGPAVGSPKTLSKKFLPQLLFTEDNMAAFTPYKSRGLVGGGKGSVLLGMDYRSRLPFSVNMFSSGSAEVFLLMGKTGSGKTYAAFQMALSALALGCYVTAIDIKGREWSKLEPFIRTKIISMDDRHTAFVNTLRLDDMVVESVEDAVEYFNTAVNGTVQLFTLVMNIQPGEANITDAELVLREAVLKMYSTRHISPNNPRSFVSTADMTYAEVIPLLDNLSLAKSYTEGQRECARLAKSRLNAYFGPVGLFAESFRNEISLGDVMASPLVIFEFGKNSGAIVDTKDTIRIFMVQYLDTKKKAMLKRKGKFLFAFYEELQRCASFGQLLVYIAAETTGSRSNNAIIVLLLNSLKVLQGEEGRDIRSNITSTLIASVEDNDIRTLREEWGLDWTASQLELFRDKPNQFRHCIAANVDNGVEQVQTLYRVELEDALSKQFHTRTIVEYDTEE